MANWAMSEKLQAWIAPKLLRWIEKFSASKNSNVFFAAALYERI